MEIKGEYKIAAPREKVFAALNDPTVLQACIPGCESLEKVSDTEMKAKVRLRIGPVSASFTGKVTLSDIDPPNGYKISGEGQGGAAGLQALACHRRRRRRADPDLPGEPLAAASRLSSAIRLTGARAACESRSNTQRVRIDAPASNQQYRGRRLHDNFRRHDRQR